jgi:secreted trypsin-like serine protease
LSRPPCLKISQLINFFPPVESIYKGTPLSGRRIPYQAGLYNGRSSTADFPYCGAALLTENYLVTSATCFEHRRDLNDFFVMLGDHNVRDMTDGQEKFEVAELKIHPGFSNSPEGIFFNDIALIRLRRPARFSPIIGSVCLPDTPGLNVIGYFR